MSLRVTRRWRHNPGLSAYLMGPYIKTQQDRDSLEHMYRRSMKHWRSYNWKKNNKVMPDYPNTRQHAQRRHNSAARRGR